ncbi:orotate phosphoribosyltransferase [Candidatus Peregrinibacteria bacterium]|nr:orotate phosphoribosyltransferase [Candidatus Peregrinibacteria bacterium]
MSAKQSIALALAEVGAVKFGEFTLKSGMKSPIYIDLRVLVSHPPLLKEIADVMAIVAKGLKFDVIAGIPYTALPIATAISIATNWPMVYARKEVKDYGTKRKLEGAFQPGQTALIIDDLITTGESKFETIQPFQEAGLKVTDIVVLVDREQGGAKILAEKGYRLHSVLGINELLDLLREANKIDEANYGNAKAFIANAQM